MSQAGTAGVSQGHGMSEALRLNIGAGDINIPGFLSVDIKTGTDASGKLPYRDGEVAEIYASHVLEHIHHSKTHATLREWVRVLAPGGRIRIAVPHFEKILKQAVSGELSLPYVNAWLYGTDNTSTDRHQAQFTYEDLEAILRSMGIEQLSEWKGEYPDNSLNKLTLNIEGRKRVTEIKSNPKVVMCLSTGRFGPIDLYAGVAELCRVKGWRLYQWGGDNWAKVLTRLIRQAIDENDPDYILTLDFDSCFDAAETVKLVEFLQTHPEIAAVWPVQAHRHNDLPLGFAWDAAAAGYYDFAKENPWKGEFTRHDSGHFGCTVIRRQVFDTMPQPWLAGLPSTKTGDWDSDALDNDIAFWVGMSAHGFTFGQLNTVQIGHMEWCCKWIVGDKIMWQPIQNYRRSGRPKNAVFDGEAWVARARAQMAMRLREANAPEETIKAFEDAAKKNDNKKAEPFKTSDAVTVSGPTIREFTSTVDIEPTPPDHVLSGREIVNGSV